MIADVSGQAASATPICDNGNTVKPLFCVKTICADWGVPIT